MSSANTGDTVKVGFIGKLENGEVFDTTEGRSPLEFKIGSQTILPALESAVIGMSTGDTATIEIPAADAFGPRLDEAIQTVNRSSFPEDIELSIGKQLQANDSQGQQLILTIVEIGDDTVTLDANHPLAGKNLIFDIELLEILEAAN